MVYTAITVVQLRSVTSYCEVQEVKLLSEVWSCVVLCCFSGHHAGGDSLSAHLHHSSHSLCQGDSPWQVLERSQKYLHHCHPHGRSASLHYYCGSNSDRTRTSHCKDVFEYLGRGYTFLSVGECAVCTQRTSWFRVWKLKLLTCAELQRQDVLRRLSSCCETTFSLRCCFLSTTKVVKLPCDSVILRLSVTNFLAQPFIFWNVWNKLLFCLYFIWNHFHFKEDCPSTTVQIISS